MPVAGLNVMLTLSWIDFSSRLLGVHVIDLQRREASELLRDADGALPAVRDVRVVGNRRLFLEIAQQAPGPVVDVAEPLQRLVVGRQRPVERVRREVGPAVVVDANDGNRQRTLRPQHVRVQDVVVVQPRAAANHGPVVDLVGEADARLHVVRVLRTVRAARTAGRRRSARTSSRSGRTAGRGSASGSTRPSSRPAPTRRISRAAAASGTPTSPTRRPGSWS